MLQDLANLLRHDLPAEAELVLQPTMLRWMTL
jgi:hypothetical protein